MLHNHLLGAAHTSYRTVSIVIAQKSCHVAVDESNRNQLASLTIAIFAYLDGKLWRKNLAC